LTHTHTADPCFLSCTTHTHVLQTTLVACGYAGANTHRHGVSMTSADSHNHTLTLTLADADGDDPAHVHAITVTDCTGGGANHKHDPVATPTAATSCNMCIKVGTHAHVNSITTNNYDYSAHTHTFPATNTSGPFGTSLRHYHTFTVTSNVTDGSHAHTCGGSVVNAVCAQGRNHGHSPTSTDAGTHGGATLPGIMTGWGGEIMHQRMVGGVGL